MPVAPATLRPRSARLGRTANQDYEARRRKVAWRAWYKTPEWRAIRRQQLNAEPLCRMCVADEPSRVRAATVCDHVRPHRGDRDRFFAGPFQSLCETCHSARKQRIERSRAAQDACSEGENL